jgi:hypothetical protein
LYTYPSQKSNLTKASKQLCIFFILAALLSQIIFIGSEGRFFYFSLVLFLIGIFIVINKLDITSSMIQFLLFQVFYLSILSVQNTNSFLLVLLIRSVIGYFIAILIVKGILTPVLWRLYFIILSFFILFNVIILKVDPNRLFDRSSQNIISILIIGAATFLYISESIIDDKRKLPLWPSVVAVFFSILGRGRSGIISSILLFLVILYLNHKKNTEVESKRNIKRLLFYLPLLFVLFITFFFLNLSTPILDYFTTSTSFEKGLETPRFELWKSFLLDLEVENIIFGDDLSKINIIWNKNLHNSYLQLFSYAPLLAIFIIILTIKSVANNLIIDSTIWILMFPILLRAVTDSGVFLSGVYDFSPYIIICYYNYRKN